jgi:transcriptional regulator GlxA family with amidase domain
MLPFSSAIDVLHTSNIVSKKTLYDCQSISEDGAPVLASNGIEVSAEFSIDETDYLSVVIVCGSVDPSHYQYRKIIRWLRNLASLGTEICAVDTGGYVLAKAGLLARRQCTFPQQIAPLLNWSVLS